MRSTSNRSGEQRLERELHEAVKGWRLYLVVEAIQALRGVELTGAVILMTELGRHHAIRHPPAADELTSG